MTLFHSCYYYHYISWLSFIINFVSICINHEYFISAAAEMMKFQEQARGMLSDYAVSLVLLHSHTGTMLYGLILYKLRKLVVCVRLRCSSHCFIISFKLRVFYFSGGRNEEGRSGSSWYV